jgi:hypothetical protein
VNKQKIDTTTRISMVRVKLATLAQKNQFYQEMAWGGLEDTEAFKALSISIRESIKNTLQVEQFNVNNPGYNANQKGAKLRC